MKTILFLLLPGLFLSAYEMPESSIARFSFRKLLTAPLHTVMQKNNTVLVQEKNMPRVRFSVEQQGNFTYFIFVPERNNSYSIASPGSYIIRRSRSDNTIGQIKIFLSEKIFLRITPTHSGSTLSIYKNNVRLYKNIQLPVPFSLLLVESFSLISHATEKIIHWEQILLPIVNEKEGEALRFQRVQDLATRISNYLPFLPDAEDGAMDAEGNLVFIENMHMQNDLPGFNCSGFAKWVADGFYYPVNGKYLDIEDLKKRHGDIRGNSWGNFFEYSRDPYFGLDWTRNIAVHLNTLNTKNYNNPSATQDPESFDVRDNTVSVYVEDVGYPLQDLEAVIYDRLRAYPGEVYLASINKPFSDSSKEMLLRQHIHIVVLMPYIDAENKVHVRVFERNVETSLASLFRRYPGEYIHLVRIPTQGEFRVPEVRAISLSSGVNRSKQS